MKKFCRVKKVLSLPNSISIDIRGTFCLLAFTRTRVRTYSTAPNRRTRCLADVAQNPIASLSNSPTRKGPFSSTSRMPMLDKVEIGQKLFITIGFACPPYLSSKQLWHVLDLFNCSPIAASLNKIGSFGAVRDVLVCLKYH